MRCIGLMTEFDEISHAIGKIEGKLDAIEKTQRAQWEKLERIEQALTANRLKLAGLAGGISALIAILSQLPHWFKGLFKWGH